VLPGKHKCVFILAGDFNFEHNASTSERNLLKSKGFGPAKPSGWSRLPHAPDRLVDNIWVKGAGITVKEIPLSELTQFSEDDLAKLSDHCPIAAEISL
jgi:endonuclease/exonuclease/phosphatase family metal-dependent hydrolase